MWFVPCLVYSAILIILPFLKHFLVQSIPLWLYSHYLISWCSQWLMNLIPFPLEHEIELCILILVLAKYHYYMLINQQINIAHKVFKYIVKSWQIVLCCGRHWHVPQQQTTLANLSQSFFSCVFFLYYALSTYILHYSPSLQAINFMFFCFARSLTTTLLLSWLHHVVNISIRCSFTLLKVILFILNHINHK